MKSILFAICFALVLPVAAAMHAVEGVAPVVYYGSEHSVTAGDKTAELAVIVVHGWGGGAKGSDGKTLREDLAKRGVKAYVVAPLFPRRSILKKAKVSDDGRAVWGATWEIPGKRGLPTDDWRGGGDAVGTTMSSFDIVDRIMEKLSDAQLYPALKRVVLVGFSAGGQFVGRYVAVGKCPLREGIAADFAVIAPSTELRLDQDTTWHYGLKGRPRYSAKLAEGDIRRNLASRRVWRGCGTADVTRGSLDMSPPACRRRPCGRARTATTASPTSRSTSSNTPNGLRRCRSTISPASATAGRSSATPRSSTSSPVLASENNMNGFTDKSWARA